MSPFTKAARRARIPQCMKKDKTQRYARHQPIVCGFLELSLNQSLPVSGLTPAGWLVISPPTLAMEVPLCASHLPSYALTLPKSASCIPPPACTGRKPWGGCTCFVRSCNIRGRTYSSVCLKGKNQSMAKLRCVDPSSTPPLGTATGEVKHGSA